MADMHATFTESDSLHAKFEEVIQIQPTGTKEVTYTANGEYSEDIAAFGDIGVTVDVPNTYTAEDEGKVVDGGALISQTQKNIGANGTHDTTVNDVVEVDVPNSYTDADEGKVVDNGALVEQGSLAVSANGTYDTTKKNQVTIDVPTGDEWEEVLLWENPDPTQSVNAGAELNLAESANTCEYFKLQVTGQNSTQLRTFIVKNDAAYWAVFVGTNRCCRGFGRNVREDGSYYISVNTDAYQIDHSSSQSTATAYTDRVIPISVYGIRKNRTVLYSDGTFIINEKILDSEENIRLHGAASYTYPPFNANNDYVFPATETALWATEMSLISSVKFGDKIAPTSLAYWFDKASNLVDIDWTYFDGSNVTTARSFLAHTALTSISLPPMPNLEFLQYTFNKCPNLRTVDLSRVGSTKISSMDSSFNGSDHIVTIDLSGISGVVKNANATFAALWNVTTPMALTTILVNPNLDFSSATGKNTFRRCNNLVGGAGTTWDSNYTDKTYARIDNPPNAPGYFTLKET